MKKTTQWMLTTLVAMGSAACGAAVAPEELNTARDAMAQAERANVAEVSPVKLEEAKQALAKAEAAFNDGDDDEIVKSLAYIATRKAELAVAVGEQERAKHDIDQAAKDKIELQTNLLNLSEEQRKRLEEARKMGDAEVARVKSDLEKERLARAEAEKRAAAAMASLAEIAKVKEESRGTVITLQGAVLFTTGSANLMPIAKDQLSKVAAAIKDQGYQKIIVEGHTDSQGSPAKNEALSQQRAESVRTYFITQGIDSTKIEAAGYGPSKPVAPNDTAEGRANNRRVEIVVTPVR
jgi:outer membrane protein OmpA-like peptidoglycan-associated protein